MTITIYLETNREACLDGIPFENLETDSAEYDKHIDDYIAFLQKTAKEDNIEIETANRAAGRSYQADTDNEDVWMLQQLDFWEWYHSYQPPFIESNNKE